MASNDFLAEKGEKTTVISSDPSDSLPLETESAEFDTAPPPPPSGILARLRHYETLLDDKLGVEKNGPARILPEERNTPNQAIMALMWASGTMNLSCFATGFLGWEFGLDLKQSILTVIFGTLLGSLVTVRKPSSYWEILCKTSWADFLLLTGLVRNTRSWDRSSSSRYLTIQLRLVAFQDNRCPQRHRTTRLVFGW